MFPSTGPGSVSPFWNSAVTGIKDFWHQYLHSWYATFGFLLSTRYFVALPKGVRAVGWLRCSVSSARVSAP